ncbi:MAG TPA: M12 family metallopeptidase, partial [Polyangiaceae bacterium]|nr:M12 family metallopeptidase [Polyangiaceae bacterium]
MKLSRYGYANLFLMIALTAGCSSSSELAPTDTDPDSRLEVRGGYVFLEGDINLGPANDGAGKRMQSAGLFDRTRRFQGTSVQFPTYSGGPWTDGIVPWRFDGSVSAGKQADFRAAVAHYHQHTSIQWVEVGNTYSGDHVLVKGDDTSDLGCWSYLGKHGTGAQELQVGRPSNCAFGNMIHEMGHTLGFIHEHQRPDRDSFVTVNKTGENYDKETNASVSLFGNYDMSSIMHYCQDITVKG